MTLGQLRETLFERSKRWWRYYFCAQAIVVLVSGMAVFLTKGYSSIILGVASVGLPFVTFWLRGAAQSHYRMAERIRRMEVVWDGLGREPSDLEVSMVANAADVQLERGLLGPSPFASRQPAGAARLAENLQESAFFTADLAGRVVGRCVLVVSGALGVSLILLYVVARRPELGSEELARLVSIAVVFFSAGEFASLGRSFSTLAKTAGAVTSECSRLRERRRLITDVDALLVMDEYDCALANTAPLPSKLHRRHKERLSKNWTPWSVDSNAQGD